MSATTTKTLQIDWSFKDKGEDSGTEPRPAELLAEGGENTEWEKEGGYKYHLRNLTCYRILSCYCHKCLSCFAKIMYMCICTGICVLFSIFIHHVIQQWPW